MAFSVKVSLDWDDGLSKKINTAVQKSTLQAAKEVEATAKRLAPKATGELRNSIRAVKSKFKDGGAIIISGNDKAFYAHMVEYGTVNMSAKPHLRPALRQNKNKTVKIVQSAVEQATK